MAVTRRALVYFSKYKLIQQATRERSDLLLPGTKLWDIAINAVAKRDDNNPYLIANEQIAFQLGRLVGVPVVSGLCITGVPRSLSDSTGEQAHWASFSVGEDLPDGDADEVISGSLDVAVGCVAFDAWICNGDRHAKNFTYSAESRTLLLFDHGESLCNKVGPPHIQNCRCSLGLRGTHEIGKRLPELRGIESWCEKIQQISSGAIKHIVSSACEIGLPVNEAFPLAEALIQRQRNLMYLFATKVTREDFPSLNPTLLGLQRTARAFPTEFEIPFDLIEDDHSDYSI